MQSTEYAPHMASFTPLSVLVVGVLLVSNFPLMNNERDPRISRRTLAHGVTWAAPTVITAVAAPAVAASLRKDPGLNGWVSNRYAAGTCGSANTTVEITSIATGTTPDGAPFGLYLYDTDNVKSATGATITYWVLGNHGTTDNTAITWSNASGHSSCWNYQGRVGTAVKPDGLTYTGYRWIHTCAIDPKATTTGTDGIKRVFLGNFHVTTNSFRQPTGSCGKLNVWTERSVILDGVTKTFQRRAGTDGAYVKTAARSARSTDSQTESSPEEVKTVNS